MEPVSKKGEPVSTAGEPVGNAGPQREVAREKAELPYRPGLRQTLNALYEIKIHTVFIMVATSLGLGLIAPQVTTIAVLVFFAVFWGATVIAMVVLAARMLNDRSGNGRHRRVAPS